MRGKGPVSVYRAERRIVLFDVKGFGLCTTDAARAVKLAECLAAVRLSQGLESRSGRSIFTAARRLLFVSSSETNWMSKAPPAAVLRAYRRRRRTIELDGKVLRRSRFVPRADEMMALSPACRAWPRGPHHQPCHEQPITPAKCM